MEKLVYLLRAGYRPQTVMLLDGWNDIITLARCNLRVEDLVAYHTFTVNRGAVAFTPGDGQAAPLARTLMETLPVMRLLPGKAGESWSAGRVVTGRDAFLDGFDFQESRWMHFHWDEWAGKNQDLLVQRTRTFYRHNVDFLQRLASAFGFRLFVYFQPMGLFDPRNPFVPAAARETPGYRVLARMRETVRHEIKKGGLAMVDLSDCLDRCDDAYVDVAHYSPRAHRVLADVMANALVAR